MLQLFHILTHLITISCDKHCNLLHGRGATEVSSLSEELLRVADSYGRVTPFGDVAASMLFMPLVDDHIPYTRGSTNLIYGIINEIKNKGSAVRRETGLGVLGGDGGRTGKWI